jgi:hypothetical protein
MRTDKDYIGNPHHANVLANRITSFWKQKGMPWKAYVVIREVVGRGGKKEKFYDIRSDIKVTNTKETKAQAYRQG